MPVDIIISEAIVKEAEDTLNKCFPSTISELWEYYNELSSCLRKIRDDINHFIDSCFPSKASSLCVNRTNSMFDDSNVSCLEKRIEERMDECSMEVERITRSKQEALLANLDLEENKNVE